MNIGETEILSEIKINFEPLNDGKRDIEWVCQKLALKTGEKVLNSVDKCVGGESRRKWTRGGGGDLSMLDP
jgi:hypothetical protein